MRRSCQSASLHPSRYDLWTVIELSAVFRDLAAPPQDQSCGPLSSHPCLPSYPSPPHTRSLLVAKRPKNFGLFIWNPNPRGVHHTKPWRTLSSSSPILLPSPFCPPFPFPFSVPSPYPSVRSRTPLSPAKRSGGAFWAPPVASGAEPPAEIEFGAF